MIKSKKQVTGLKVLWMISLAFMAFSCDVLESDPDVLIPTTEITGREIFTLANSETFIDLNSALKTNVPAHITLTTDARHGKITDLGKGILQYTPTTGTTRSRDGFEFTVSTLDNQIIKRDSVIIIIENDSTNLPCNIYPVSDYVYGVNQNPVVIDVTSNDVICGGPVAVSIFKPGNSFPPNAGQAEVQGNKIKYTPGPAFHGVDKILYKLTVIADSVHSAYGIVYILQDSACSFRLANDQYLFSANAADSLINLPVFDNDSLCESLGQYQINLKTSPRYGYASRAPDGFTYKVPASVELPFIDHFVYELCRAGICKTAGVDVILKDSVIACSIQARPDSINIAYSTAPMDSIAVLVNDLVCGQLKSVKITKAPSYGTADVKNLQLVYTGTSQPDKDDVLEYEICNSVACSTASVFIKRTK